MVSMNGFFILSSPHKTVLSLVSKVKNYHQPSRIMFLLQQWGKVSRTVHYSPTNLLGSIVFSHLKHQELLEIETSKLTRSEKRK